MRRVPTPEFLVGRRKGFVLSGSDQIPEPQPSQEGGYTVYYRPDTKHPWVAVGTAPTHLAAVMLLGVGHRGGDWWIERAMVAAKVANMRREDTLKQNQKPDAPMGASGPAPVSQREAAQMLNVSEGPR